MMPIVTAHLACALGKQQLKTLARQIWVPYPVSAMKGLHLPLAQHNTAAHCHRLSALVILNPVPTPEPPAVRPSHLSPLCLQLSVVTCMDSRLMVASMLGLDIGDIGEYARRVFM